MGHHKRNKTSMQGIASHELPAPKENVVRLGYNPRANLLVAQMGNCVFSGRDYREIGKSILRSDGSSRIPYKVVSSNILVPHSHKIMKRVVPAEPLAATEVQDYLNERIVTDSRGGEHYSSSGQQDSRVVDSNHNEEYAKLKRVGGEINALELKSIYGTIDSDDRRELRRLYAEQTSLLARIQNPQANRGGAMPEEQEMPSQFTPVSPVPRYQAGTRWC